MMIDRRGCLGILFFAAASATILFFAVKGVIG